MGRREGASSLDFLAWKACVVQMALASQFPIGSRKTPYNAGKHIRNTSLHNSWQKSLVRKLILRVAKVERAYGKALTDAK